MAQVYQYGENYDDNGVGIPVEIVTKEYYPGGIELTKSFHRVFMFSNKNSGLSAQYRIIQQGARRERWIPLGRLNNEVNVFNFPSGYSRGNGVQFKLIKSGTGIPPVFKGLTIVYSVEGVRE